MQVYYFKELFYWTIFGFEPIKPYPYFSLNAPKFVQILHSVWLVYVVYGIFCAHRWIRTNDQRIRFHGWTWTNDSHAYVLLFCKSSTNWVTWNTIRLSELLCIQSVALPLSYVGILFVLTTGFEPVWQEWKSCILTLRWNQHFRKLPYLFMDSTITSIPRIK